jgi:signal transduction histidine kinase
MITFSSISYINVKKAAMKAGRERLNAVSDQLSTMMGQSAQGMIAATRTVAMQEPVKRCLSSLQPDGCEESLPLLEKLRQDSSSIMIEILNDELRPVLRSAKAGIESKVNFGLLLSSIRKRNADSTLKLDSGTVGKISRIRDSMYYPITVGITNNKQLIGYLVRWRLITSSTQSIQQLSELLGAKSTIYFGNADHSLWTDMIRPIPNPIPPATKPGKDVFEYRKSNGQEVLGVEKAIRNTPWLLVMEFSHQTVVEPAKRFLAQVVIISAVLIAIGIFAAWIMSRNITRPLNKLTDAATMLASGRETPQVAVDRRDEIGKLARAFNAMTEQIRIAKRDLERKVVEAEQMNVQLRELSAHLQNIREEERIHIAREMHDELGQLLTGFKMDTSWLNKKLAGNNDPAVQEKLQEMMSLVDDAALFVRKLAAELRPSILDDLGLIPALEWHSREFAKRFNIDVDLKSHVPELHTSNLVATGLFRMYQESLTNVARHSGARRVASQLELVDGKIKLSIKDDGKGFDIAGTGEKKTLGLLGMKERATMIGGKLEIDSKPGKGTQVTITVPAGSD